MYGLDDAPRRWFPKISGYLTDASRGKEVWEQPKLDPCLFFLRQAGQLVGVMVTHVDDVLLLRWCSSYITLYVRNL